MLPLILAIFLTFEYTPHPNNPGKNTYSLHVRFLCKDGLILYNASIKAVRKLSSEGVSVLIGEW